MTTNVISMQGVQQRPDGSMYRVRFVNGVREEVPYEPSWRYEIRGTSFLTESGEERVRVIRIDADGSERTVA